MIAQRRNVYHRSRLPPQGMPDRRQQLSRVARAELKLVCSLLLKCGTVVLAVKGLIGIAALGNALAPESMAVAAIAPYGISGAGPAWSAGEQRAGHY